MRLEHRGRHPRVHPSAYVASTAVLCGDVRIGADTAILHGAVLTDDGGRVELGAGCVVMEHAVLRGTGQWPLRVGDAVLIGPHAYLTGCDIEDEVFVATGAMVFNGARMGRASSVALGGAVHIGVTVPPQTKVPIGWVAVGEPMQLYPPGEAQSIRDGLTQFGGFLPFVFGVPDSDDRGTLMRSALEKYTRALGRHRDDKPLD